MAKISINGITYESNGNISIVNGKVISDGDVYINGKRQNDLSHSYNPDDDKTVSKRIDISNIESFYNTFFNVELVIDPLATDETLIITGKENELQRISSAFKNKSLSLECSGSFSQISVTLRAKQISKIVNIGTGTITGYVQTNNLEISNDGVGEFKLSGEVNHLDVKASGVGDIKLFDLMSNSAKCSVSGVGTVKVSTKNLQKGSISGIGNLKYYADEEGKTSVSGLGKAKYLGKANVKPSISPIQNQKEPSKQNNLQTNEKSVSLSELQEEIKKPMTAKIGGFFKKLL